MANYQEFMQCADETALSLTRSPQNWTAFLRAAARLYKYSYNEQLMIYSQRPDATACAEFDIWNKRNQQILRDIELIIKHCERAKLAERTENNGRTDLHTQRRLLNPEPDLSGSESNLREVRGDNVLKGKKIPA